MQHKRTRTVLAKYMAIRNICTIVTESVVPQTKMELVVISVMDQVKISAATASVPDVSQCNY